MPTFSWKYVMGQTVRIVANGKDGEVIGVLFRKNAPPLANVRFANNDGDIRTDWFDDEELAAPAAQVANEASA